MNAAKSAKGGTRHESLCHRGAQALAQSNLDNWQRPLRQRVHVPPRVQRSCCSRAGWKPKSPRPRLMTLPAVEDARAATRLFTSAKAKAASPSPITRLLVTCELGAPHEGT